MPLPQYLPQATNVLWMEEGRIKAQGTYEELVAQGELQRAPEVT
jgi:ABC-type multidrug transport system fused ATPase/permease subunit